MTDTTSRPGTGSKSFKCLFAFLAVLLLAPGSALAAAEAPYPYTFFTRLAVTESVAASCSYPCATPVVAKVDFYLKGGFTIQGDKVIGEGEIEVIPHSECTVVADKGGGSGSSCRIAGPKSGGQRPQPFPVNHYRGSYQALLEQSGLVGRPTTVVAMKAENFVGDELMGKMSREFAAELELPAPGFIRSFRAAGTLAFTESPHLQ